MVRSMTGFGRAQVELDDKKLTVEIKSLNGKQMDLSTRIPSLLREKELEVRSYLTGRLVRGKVDLLIYTEAADADNSHDINAATVASYREQLQASNLRSPPPTASRSPCACRMSSGANAKSSPSRPGKRYKAPSDRRRTR